jgi:hypothetical protein
MREFIRNYGVVGICIPVSYVALIFLLILTIIDGSWSAVPTALATIVMTTLFWVILLKGK